jgi:hypothetical protein
VLPMPTYSVQAGGSIAENAAYYLMRRGQAKIASRQHFSSGELLEFRDRSAFATLAGYCCGKYFPHCENLEIGKLVHDLYIDVQVMAPLLQRLPYSMKFDWRRGHVLTWFRVNCNDHIKRFYYSATTFPRTFAPDILTANLNQLGIHCPTYTGMLVEQYKQHYGGGYVRNLLAHCLFDPIVLLNEQEGFTLRVANTIHRLEKEPFPGCVDLSRKQAKINGDYQIRFRRKKKETGGYLVIELTHDAIGRFKDTISTILASNATPEHKYFAVNDRMRNFLECAQWARSAWEQVKDLRYWLVENIKPLYGCLQKAPYRNEHDFASDYVERRKDGLFLTAPSFFWNPAKVELSTFLQYMSPYRET